MKLIERLKPEIREALETYGETYPATFQASLANLGEVESIYDITFGTMESIRSALYRQQLELPVEERSHIPRAHQLQVEHWFLLYSEM